MTSEDIIRMAREAGLAPIYSGCDVPNVSCAYEDWDEELERFAALVAAAERQRCAWIAREFDREHPNTNYGGYIARLIEETNP